MAEPVFTTIANGPQTWEIVVPFVLIAGLAVTVPALLVFANRFLGRLVNGVAPTSPGKDTPIECGLTATVGTAGERFSVKFYLVAMLFLAFDIEVAFLYAWAWKFGQVGASTWPLLFMLIAFLVLLEVGYLYLYRKGALDWDA